MPVLGETSGGRRAHGSCNELLMFEPKLFGFADNAVAYGPDRVTIQPMIQICKIRLDELLNTFRSVRAIDRAQGSARAASRPLHIPRRVVDSPVEPNVAGSLDAKQRFLLLAACGVLRLQLRCRELFASPTSHRISHLIGCVRAGPYQPRLSCDRARNEWCLKSG
jgi:hypothetical protein